MLFCKVIYRNYYKISKGIKVLEKTTSRIIGILLLIVLNLGMVVSISNASFVPVGTTQGLEKVETTVLDAIQKKGVPISWLKWLSMRI